MVLVGRGLQIFAFFWNCIEEGKVVRGLVRIAVSINFGTFVNVNSLICNSGAQHIRLASYIFCQSNSHLLQVMIIAMPHSQNVMRCI